MFVRTDSVPLTMTFPVTTFNIDLHMTLTI